MNAQPKAQSEFAPIVAELLSDHPAHEAQAEVTSLSGKAVALAHTRHWKGAGEALAASVLALDALRDELQEMYHEAQRSDRLADRAKQRAAAKRALTQRHKAMNDEERAARELRALQG